MPRVLLLLLHDDEGPPQAAALRAQILDGLPKVAPFLPGSLFGGATRRPPEELRAQLAARQLGYAEVSDLWWQQARNAYKTRRHAQE